MLAAEGAGAERRDTAQARRAAGQGKRPATRPLLVRVATAAARLDVSPQMVRKLIGQGKLSCCRIGRAIRIPVADLERLAREPSPEPEPETISPSSVPIPALTRQRASTLVSSDPATRAQEILRSLRRR